MTVGRGAYAASTSFDARAFLGTPPYLSQSASSPASAGSDGVTACASVGDVRAAVRGLVGAVNALGQRNEEVMIRQTCVRFDESEVPPDLGGIRYKDGTVELQCASVDAFQDLDVGSVVGRFGATSRHTAHQMHCNTPLVRRPRP